jgi:hypothetical protein
MLKERTINHRSTYNNTITWYTELIHTKLFLILTWDPTTKIQYQISTPKFSTRSPFKNDC